jgi:Fur family ferric uptake transcriptional regulator
MAHESVAAYNEKLIARGVRLTPQRMMVLEALAAQPGHTTAEKVLASVQARYPYVNKTTVYRTLELLSQLGLVAISHSGGNQAEYELIDSPHHHLICKECGTVIELPDSTLNPLRALVEAEHGFRPCLDHFTLFGVCRVCQERAIAAAR